jgi:hypothetical protein
LGNLSKFPDRLTGDLGRLSGFLRTKGINLIFLLSSKFKLPCLRYNIKKKI